MSDFECPVCKGTGIYSGICSWCRGAGRVPNIVEYEGSCGYCYGTGKSSRIGAFDKSESCACGYCLGCGYMYKAIEYLKECLSCGGKGEISEKQLIPASSIRSAHYIEKQKKCNKCNGKGTVKDLKKIPAIVDEAYFNKMKERKKMERKEKGLCLNCGDQLTFFQKLIGKTTCDKYGCR